jgi:2-polyprenyl-6-methoxyphenol hydroxylase-like FAD-dependent oxidoreductase
MHEPFDVPVLIVGAGPTGAMASLLLQRLGVESRIVERRTAPSQAPAAHAINARTRSRRRRSRPRMRARRTG